VQFDRVQPVRRGGYVQGEGAVPARVEGEHVVAAQVRHQVDPLGPRPVAEQAVEDVPAVNLRPDHRQGRSVLDRAASGIQNGQVLCLQRAGNGPAALGGIPRFFREEPLQTRPGRMDSLLVPKRQARVIVAAGVRPGAEPGPMLDVEDERLPERDWVGDVEAVGAQPVADPPSFIDRDAVVKGAERPEPVRIAEIVLGAGAGERQLPVDRDDVVALAEPALRPGPMAENDAHEMPSPLDLGETDHLSPFGRIGLPESGMQIGDIPDRSPVDSIIDVIVEIDDPSTLTSGWNDVGGRDPGRPVERHVPPAVPGSPLAGHLDRPRLDGRVDPHGYAEEIPNRRLDAGLVAALPIKAEHDVPARVLERHPDMRDRAGPGDIGHNHLLAAERQLDDILMVSIPGERADPGRAVGLRPGKQGHGVLRGHGIADGRNGRRFQPQRRSVVERRFRSRIPALDQEKRRQARDAKRHGQRDADSVQDATHIFRQPMPHRSSFRSR